MRRVIIGIVACSMSLLLSACRVEPDMVVMSDVDVNGWSECTTLTYNNRLTEQCDLNIMLHINNRFSKESIALEITTLTPDSLRLTEQVTLPIDFKWEQPTATTADITLPYRRNVTLRCEGDYVWQITPLESIDGVEAVGINFKINN
ncbi:MAG: hypothetical protein IKY76_01850 [Alistipes sp.]|nr:hypothetical protein [Alistipes sp.]